MKNTTIFIALAALTCTSGLAQEPQSYTEDFKRALRNGAKVRFVVRVVDDHEEPVAHAAVATSFQRANERSIPFQALTDSNGLCIVEGITTRSTFGTVSKPGYYRSTFQFRYGDSNINDHGGTSSEVYYDSKVKNGRWLPWNPTIPVVLREVRNPIAMYATSIDKHSIPIDTDMGFDFEKQDWVPPHGKGVVVDFYVRFEAITEAEYDGACRLILSSPDRDGGFIRKRNFANSEFVSEYEAPLTGYASFQTKREAALKFYERNPTDLSEDDHLIVKSRIVRDLDGNLVSANYGKIYGKLGYRFSRNLEIGAISFVYYFNPTPNDRNMEFDTDMSKNLFGPGNWQMPFPDGHDDAPIDKECRGIGTFGSRLDMRQSGGQAEREQKETKNRKPGGQCRTRSG